MPEDLCVSFNRNKLLTGRLPMYLELEDRIQSDLTCLTWTLLFLLTYTRMLNVIELTYVLITLQEIFLWNFLVFVAWIFLCDYR